MGLLEETLRGKSLADYTNTQLRLALGAVLYTNTADMWKQYLNQMGYSGDVSQMLQKYYIDNNVPAQFRNYINAGASIYNPYQLFLSGAKGAVYDASDLSTLYLDAAGTTAATVNGLVGLQLDKSAGLALGAEKNADVGFDSPASWSTPAETSVSGGLLNFTATTATRQPVTTIGASAPTAGKWYEITYTVTSISSGSVFIVYGGAVGISRTSAGTYKEYMLAVNSVTLIVPTASSGTTASIDNLSVKEIQGNHRYQSTTGSKPILRGSPVGGNTVTNPNFDSDVSWSKGAGWTIGSGVATATAATGLLSATMATAVIASRVYRVTYTIVTATAGSVAPNIGGITGTSRSAAGTYVDWITSFNTGAFVFSPTTFSGTIDNVEVVDVSAGQVQAPYWLQYDGVDDFLQTASVDFTATDKMFVCAGVRKLSDAGQAVVAELSADSNTNLRAWRLDAPSSPTTRSYSVQSLGTLQSGIFITGYAAPNTAVIGGVLDIAGDLCRLRVNGAQVAENTADQGTGNYGNYPIYFGRRGGTVIPYNGLESRTVICGKTLSATELASTERWVAQGTGVTF